MIAGKGSWLSPHVVESLIPYYGLRRLNFIYKVLEYIAVFRIFWSMGIIMSKDVLFVGAALNGSPHLEVS